MPPLFLPNNRRSTVAIPENRDDYRTHLLKFKSPMDTGYPTMLTMPSTSKLLKNAYDRNLFNVSLNDTVLKSWMVTEETHSPSIKPTLSPVPRSLQLNAGEPFGIEGALAIHDSLKRFIKDRIDDFVIVLPVFDRLSPGTCLVVGFIVATLSSYFPVQVADKKTLEVFKEQIMEEEGIFKFVINAYKELPIYWVQVPCSPKSVLCMTTAALKILETFEIAHKREADAIMAGTSPMLPFWKYFDVGPLAVSTGYIDGLNGTVLQSSVKSVVSLASIILAGVHHVPTQPTENWKTSFKYNRLRSIDSLRSHHLTKHLGLNFWQAVAQAISERRDLEIYILCFLFANYGSEVTRSEVGYVAGLDIYNEVIGVVRHAEEFEAELEAFQNRQDGPYLDTRTFKYLAANIFLKQVHLHYGTEMGTVGEMLRRISHYIPSCLP